MTDGLGLFDNSHGDLDDHDDRRQRRGRGGPPPRRKRKASFWVILAVVVAVIIGGAYYGITQVLGFGSYDDYAGSGETDVVVEVKAGQGTAEIGTALKAKDVVASARAFIAAGEDQTKVKGVRPGFYVMKTKMSGKAAVDKIIAKDSRVGELQIKAGTQLDDITQPDGKVTPGVLSLISRAGRATLNGKETGPTPEELRKAAETADLQALGAPSWAIPDASKAPEPRRRLEGLIVPGVYDVQPGLSAEELLKKVISDSATTLEGWGMPKLSDPTGYTPYQVLVMGSLVEKEGIQGDFAKIARVTYGRLATTAPQMRLEYDSTVNYVLDRPAITTTAADRERAGAYNTYKNVGLPPTPIAATSKEALTAAAKPADGPWLYFVKCQKDGTSCFATTLPEHNKNVSDARARGAF